MAEKVNIASLTIDVDDVVKESVRLQKVIDSTKAAQKSLDTTTDEGAASYQKYDAQLKNTKKALRDNQQFVSALDEADKDLTKTM
jgi:phage host-nuclease inhibitor protein Gam